MRVRETLVVPGGRLVLAVAEYHEGRKASLQGQGGVMAGAVITLAGQNEPGEDLISIWSSEWVRYAVQAWDVANENAVNDNRLR
jgi:hypothetical protein